VLAFAKHTGILDVHRTRGYLSTANWSKTWLLFNLALWHECFLASAGAGAQTGRRPTAAELSGV
jgi:hypothetical protein